MIGFPLLLIPLAIYNIIAFLMPDVRFGEPLFKLALMSGTEWPVTLSDMLHRGRHPAAVVRESSRARVPARNISPTICCR